MPRGKELEDLISFCKVMAESPFYRKLGAGGVMSIVLTAKELNLPMMPCLNGGMYNIDGKVSLSAQLMNALILLQGHEVKPIEISKNRCALKFKRKGEDDWQEFEYTAQDAKEAGYLGKNNWRSHLKDMLYCRCLSGGARKFMPDALMGCYIEGEMGDDKPFTGVLIPEYEEIEQEVEKSKAIEQQKNPGFDEFVEKHGLKIEGTKKLFFDDVMSGTKKTEVEIINHAIENEKSFESAYHKWMEANGYADSNDLEAQELDELEETQD